MAEHFDLVVIGSGPAGSQGAAQAAALGKQVALVEREPHLGGTGINTGTMPSKMLRETAHYLAGLRQRAPYGLQYSLQDGLTVGDFLYRKDVVVEGAWGIIQRNLERHHIRILWGAAQLQDEHTVLVRGQSEEGPTETELTADVVLIATGASPRHPEGVPFDHPLVRDSVTILDLNHLPASLVVCGGGIAGCEYASIFNALGVDVTLIETRNRVLGFVDGEIAQRWQRHLERQGVKFILGDDIAEWQPADDRVRLRLSSGLRLEAGAVLVAVGRTGNVHGLGLAEVGVRLTGSGLIAINEHGQTAVPNIYAAGDVVGFPALASTSMEQARLAMVHAFGRAEPGAAPAPGPAPLASAYPLAVYTIPEIAMVGLSEEACQQQNLPYLVGRGFFDRNPRAQITGDTSGLLKLLFSPEDQRLLGVHIMGEQAAELVHLGAHVLASGGTLASFTSAVYNYPTLSEVYKYAAYDGLDRLAAAQQPD